MSQPKESPNRFVGLDVHKRYLLAAAVDPDRNEVMNPRRVSLARLDEWIRKRLRCMKYKRIGCSDNRRHHRMFNTPSSLKMVKHPLLTQSKAF